MYRMMLVGVTALMIGSAVLAAVGGGDTAPHFTLSDINDAEYSTRTERTTALVVIFSTKDLGDFSLAWRDSLTTHGVAADIQTVLDLDDVSRFLRPIARLKIANKGSKAVLDWDGSVSEAWRGEDRSQVVTMVVASDNTVMLVVTGEATSENVGEVLAQAATGSLSQ
jgi:hypothetical protein